MKQSKLDKILELHELYAKTEGEEGKRADLRWANLRWTILRGVDLRRANLREADQSWASLEGADLSRAILYKADLIGTNLSASILTGADLRGANLSASILTGADLIDVDLRWTNLEGANLIDVDLTGADLSGANLKGANLKGADLCLVTGNNKQIKNIVIEDEYHIAYTIDRLQIGRKNHSIEEWKNFSDEDIYDMGGCKAIDFWNKYKDYIFETINKDPAITTGVIEACQY